MRHAPRLLPGEEVPAVEPVLRGSAVWAAAAGVRPQAHADPRVSVPGCVRADQVGLFPEVSADTAVALTLPAGPLVPPCLLPLEAEAGRGGGRGSS